MRVIRTAIEPPARAMRAAGSVNGKMQHAVQAAAASAVAAAAPAALLPVFPVVFVVAAQPQPGEFSDGGVQDGPITLM
jgi:hypothetical protein